jgi:hypothetical protein
VPKEKMRPFGYHAGQEMIGFFHNLTSLFGSLAISYSNKNLIVHKAEVIRVENFLLRLKGGWRQLRLSDLQVTVSIVVLSL